MDKKLISMVSGVTLLTLSGAAWAGPMPITSAKDIAAPVQVEQVRYYRHYYHHHGWRHYGWHRGWHYGWYRHRSHYGWRYRRYHYGWRYPGYYGWNPVAAAAGTAVGLAALPFAVAGGWPYYGYGYPYGW